MHETKGKNVSMKNLKNKVLFSLIALLTVFSSGCSGRAEKEPVPTPPITGGKVDRSDTNAPKVIDSRDLTFFSYQFYLYGKYNYEKDSGYSFEVKKMDDGTVSLEEKSCYKVKCSTDEHILAALQSLIEKYGLAKMNGADEHTAGLPVEFQPCYFRAEYASGESIRYSTNNNPEDPFSREVVKLLGDEFAARGEDCFQPPVNASRIKRFDLEYTDGDIRWRIGELRVPKEGVHKSFEDLVTHGYADGEYDLVIEKEAWDRSKDAETASVYRVLTPEYYEGLAEILNRERIIDFVNDEQFPSGFDYEKTPAYYNFYVEYAAGNNFFGFSDDAEKNREFARVAKAVAQYADEYISADPLVMQETEEPEQETAAEAEPEAAAESEPETAAESEPETAMMQPAAAMSQSGSGEDVPGKGGRASVVVCPGCGSMVAKTGKYCPVCGTKLWDE